MSDIYFTPPQSPLTADSVAELMRHSDLSLEALGIGCKRAKQHTLALINRIARASLQYALYAPDYSFAWKFELTPDKKSVVSAEYFDRKWEANPAKVFGSEAIPADRIFYEPKQISYRELALAWNPIDQRCSITIENFFTLTNTIRRDEFEIDLQSGEVHSHERSLSDIVGLRGDGAGNLFALESGIAHEHLNPLNHSLNDMLSTAAKYLGRMGDHYQTEFQASAGYFAALDKASTALAEKTTITLTDVRDEISRAIVSTELDTECDAFQSLQDVLDRAQALDAELAYKIISTYAKRYLSHHHLPDQAVTIEHAEQRVITSDQRLFTKLRGLLGGHFAELVELQDSVLTTTDTWVLNILTNELREKFERGDQISFRYDRHRQAYFITNLSEAALLEVQRRTGGDQIFIDPKIVEFLKSDAAVRHLTSNREYGTLGEIRATSIDDLFESSDHDIAERIHDELRHAVLNGALDPLTHDIVYSGIKWHGLVESLKTHLRRGIQPVLEVHETGSTKLKFYHRRPEDSWRILEQLRQNGFDIIMFSNESPLHASDIVVYRLQDRCAKLIAAELWNVNNSLLAAALIKELQKRHQLDAIEFPTERSASLFGAHQAAFRQADSLGVQFVHAGRCEIRNRIAAD